MVADGPKVDGYSDLIQVAKGGFGTVYRARQDRHGRDVALKILHVDHLDEATRRRFDRECVAMGSLSWHPNVVSLFDSGITEDGNPYIVMEYLERSLGERVRRTGPLSWIEAVSIGIQVAGALGTAHAAGVLHRDVKPDNLLIGPFGAVKLSDFGIAAINGGTRSTTGHVSFTFAHVPPEVLRRRRPDERSDLYSLASTLYALMTGRPPFAGEPDEPEVAVIASVLHDTPPRLPGIPDDLADVLEACLAKDSSERPVDAEEFGRLLQVIQEDNGFPITELRLTPTPPRADGSLASEAPGACSNPAEVQDRRAARAPDIGGDPLPTVAGVPQGSPSQVSDPSDNEADAIGQEELLPEAGLLARMHSEEGGQEGDPHPTVVIAKLDQPLAAQITIDAPESAGAPADDLTESPLGNSSEELPQLKRTAPASPSAAAKSPGTPERGRKKVRSRTVAFMLVLVVALTALVGTRVLWRGRTEASRNPVDQAPSSSTSDQVVTTTTTNAEAVIEYAQAVEDARLLNEYLQAVKTQEDTINYAAALAQAEADARVAAEAQAAADARAASAITDPNDCPLSTEGTVCRRSFTPEGPGIYYP